jgi:membrane protein
MATIAPKPRRLGADLARAFERNDLPASASAISFQVLTALVPFLLFAFALLGFLDLSGVWEDDVAPEVEPHLSQAAFTLIDDTVTKVLASGTLFWLTAGLLLAVWQISGAVRVAMRALDRIYGVEVERSWRNRMLTSAALAALVGGAWLAAIAVVTVVPLAHGDVGQPLGALLFVLRWLLAGAFVLVAVGLMLRHGPAKVRPIKWVSFGTLLAIGSWIAMSIGFGAYLRFVADYASVFGNLATVVILLGYVYLSATAFLAGAQVDALVRERAAD